GPPGEAGEGWGALGRLRGGVGGARVDQRRPVVDGALQDREVLADPRDVQAHVAAPARTQRSYPSASRVSASSGPPSSTIRPPTNTCTKSGFTYRRIRV